MFVCMPVFGWGWGVQPENLLPFQMIVCEGQMKANEEPEIKIKEWDY